MAKRFTDPVIIVSWFDSTGMKQRSHLAFSGSVDKRRMFREVSRFMRVNFNCRPHSLYVKGLVKANIVAFTQVMKPAMMIADRKVSLNSRLEEWIKRIQDESDEGEGCPTGEEPAQADAGEQVSAVSPRPERDTE